MNAAQYDCQTKIDAGYIKSNVDRILVEEVYYQSNFTLIFVHVDTWKIRCCL